MSAVLVSGALVIGIGNTLAGDDGIGARVARWLRGGRLPSARVLVVHQLTPELAEDVAGAARVIFVDAGVTGSGVEVTRLTPAATWGALHHALAPAELLGLTTAVYGYCPEAFLVMIPGHAFEPGARLSREAHRHFPAAARVVRTLL